MTKEVAMTRYAVDQGRGVLTRTIATRAGETASDVALFQTVDLAARTQLAAALTKLSDALWNAYTDPESDALLRSLAADDEDDPRFDPTRVIHAVREPNLPEDGYLPPERFTSEAAAHEVGRILHTIGDPALRDLVAQEVEAEVSAVAQADTGYFAGRAAQAILLTRVKALPTQVEAAFEAFQQSPYDREAILARFDPHAASVVAAHWLLCAAQIAAQTSGINVESIMLVADDLEMIPVETTSTMLSLQAHGKTPDEAVSVLIGIALGVARGLVSAAVIESLTAGGQPVNGPVQISSIDPRRPAPDLLEALLDGIEGAFLVWDDYDDTDPVSDDLPDHEWEKRQTNRRTTFAYLVEDAATASKSRLRLR